MSAPRALPHVLWLGGGPGAGKTTVARRLARRHGLRLYSADTRTWEHRDRALAQGVPAARRWEALAPEERDGGADAAEALALSLHRERGAMVVDDLRALPRSPLVLAEGSPLPAWAVTAGLADRSRALWPVAPAGVRRARLAARGGPAPRARLHLLVGDLVAREAREHDVPVLAGDHVHGVAAVVDAVERRWAAALAAGPVAGSTAERRALLREANVAVVAQVRAYHARAGTQGDGEASAREVACECGEPTCEADLRLPVAQIAAGPALAPGHGLRRARTRSAPPPRPPARPPRRSST